MTDFDDVTRNFTDGLSHITQYIPQLIDELQGKDYGDTAFRNYKNNLLMGSDRQKVSFAGKGANAFGTCVENNITHAQPFQDNWNTLVENSSNLLTQFHYNNDIANTVLNNPPVPVDVPVGSRVAVARPYHNTSTAATYTTEEVWTEMREAAMKGSDMNTVMDTQKGKTYFLRQLDNARQDILADIQTQHTSRMNQFKDPNEPDVKAEPENYKDAQTDVNGLHDQLSGAITNWFDAMMPMLSDYQQGIQNNKVTVPRYMPPPTLHTKTITFPRYNEKDILYSGTIGSGSLAPTWDPDTIGIYANGRYVITGRQGVAGNNQFGLTGGAEIDGPSGNLLLGKRNNQYGLNAGASAGSVTANVGVNIAGVNVSLNGAVNAGMGFGLSFKNGFQGNFLILSGGFTVGPAKQATVPS
jgi:hypothetical protein